jgi:hypothetical protein
MKSFNDLLSRGPYLAIDAPEESTMRMSGKAEMDRLVMTSVAYDSSTSSKRMPEAHAW